MRTKIQEPNLINKSKEYARSTGSTCSNTELCDLQPKQEKNNSKVHKLALRHDKQIERLLWRFKACHQTEYLSTCKQTELNRIRANKTHKNSGYHSICKILNNIHHFLTHLLFNCLYSTLISNLFNLNLPLKCLNSFNLCTYLRTHNKFSSIHYHSYIIKMLNLNSFFFNSVHKSRLKLNNYSIHQLIFMITFTLLSLSSRSNANEACFGGIETFEKTAMLDFNSEIKPAGTLLQQTDQALTRDCIAQCKNQPICASFGLDYTKFICAAYKYTSSENLGANSLRDKMKITNTTNFFEKVCYKGIGRDEYERICGLERLWAFERVVDSFLDGFEETKIHSVASKEDCAKLCLIETGFSCRSADFDHNSKICRLSREDRRTQPQAFRQAFGSKRDYLENQCVAAGPTTCLYDTKRDSTVITMDSLLFAENLVDCQQKCDKETIFNCRAFSLNGKKCYLSGDDTISLANSALPSRPGFIYGEKHCVTEHCTNGIFTYEKITGHVLRTANANPMQIHPSNVGMTGDCKQYCDNNPLNCPAFQVNYLSSRCDVLDRNSQGRQQELMERDGENYFERICLRIPSLVNSACRDKFWTFERILGYELNPSLYERTYEQILSRRDCEEYCLLEKSFACRSALYNDESASCRLSRFDRRTRSADFNRNNNFKVSYLENQCVPTYSKCDYESVPNAYPTYTDLVVNFTSLYSIKDDRHGKQLCENRCNESREFLCRSYAFYPSTNECFLSGDDTFSGYSSAISAKTSMEYSERKCTKRNELDQTLDQIGDQVNFDDKTDSRNGDNLDELGYRTTSADFNNNNNRNTVLDSNDQTRPSLPESHTTPTTVYSDSRTNDPNNIFSPHKPNDDNLGNRDYNNKQDHHDHSLDRQNNQRTTNYPFSSSFNPSTRDDNSDSRNQQTVNPSLPTSKFNNQQNRPGFFQNNDGFPNNETTSGYSTSIRNGPGFGAGSVNTGNTQKSTTTKWSSDRFNDNSLKETVNKTGAFDSLSLNSNKCPLNNEFTFERIPSFEPIGGQQFFLHSDSKSSAITSECMRLCKINVNCTGFILDYLRHACHGIYQMYSFSKLDLRLTPGKDFFEGTCVESNRVDCDKSWMFDRIIDQNVVNNQLQPRLVLNFIDKHNCKMACLSETRFACRSLAYDLTTRECKLFDENRDSGEVELQFTKGTEYMENQCNFYDSSMCKYNSIERDLTITSITKSVPGHSTYFCEQLCNSEKEFNCRSYTYLDQTIITHGNLCLLSADSRFTSLNGSMKYRPRALFAEKDCKEAASRKGKKNFNSPASEITGRSSPTSDSQRQINNSKSSFKSGLNHHQFNNSLPSLVNRMGTKTTDQIDYDEPAVELADFNNKNRDCVYNEFTFEKTYGKQIRFSKRERIATMGNVLNSRGKRYVDLFNKSKSDADNLEFSESTTSNVFSPIQITNNKQKRNLNQITQTVQNSQAMVSLTADCQNECMRRGIACRSFIVEYGPTVGTEQCFILEDAVDERTDALDYSKYGAYFEKICLREKHCNKLWTFDRVVSFTLDMPAKRQFQVNTKLDCEDLCLAEEKFVCKSATFNYENRICKLYNENRRTKPGFFKSTKMRVDYLENQCVKEPTTCQYKEQLNSELPAVDKIIQAWNIEECTNYCNSEKLFNCKAVNFNYYTRECSMASDELTSVNIINSVKFSPIMLNPKINSVYSEKGSCEHISVQCNNENMVLQLNFDSAFFGRIYSKANPTQCYLTGNGENHLDFPIPLTPTCGTRQESQHNFVNEVVIQQHAVIMTDLDKTIKVLCSFEQSDQTVTLNRNNPNKPGLDVKTNMNARNNELDGPNSIVTNTAAPPTIVMKILDRTGNEANYVNLGDELILKIEIKERANSPFGIFARSLMAKSSNNEVLHLLDSEGCPIDHSVFPEMQIDPVDKISLLSKFKAFRFPSTGVVNFEVQIKFCPVKCEPVRCNMNQDQNSQQHMYGNMGIKSSYNKRSRRDALNEFEAEASLETEGELETEESKIKEVKIKEKTAKDFKEFALPVGTVKKKNEALPKPEFLQTSSLQELNSTKPKPETSQQVIAPKSNNGGLIYPINQDQSAYTVPYQLYYKQSRDLNYPGNGNGYSYVDPMIAAKNNYYPNQFYGLQDFQSLYNSSYLNNMASSSSSNNQIYNPFAHSSNSMSNFNNFGKMNAMRPMMNDDVNVNKNYWHPSFDQQNKPANNLVNNQLNNQLNQASLNKVKFVAPRPLSRPDGLPAVPKVTTEDINSLASDMNNEKLLHLEILVDDKKNAMKKPNSADRKKANQIEKKNKPKASIERSYQSQYIEQCNTGPIILYTSLLITLIYLGLTACAYFYYSRYVKRYADQKLLVSTLGPSIGNNDRYNLQLGQTYRTNQLNIDNRPASLFQNNINGTMRNLSSSALSGVYNSVLSQNFQTKAKQPSSSTNQAPQKSKLAQETKLKHISKEIEHEDQLNSDVNRKLGDNFISGKPGGFSRTNRFKLDN